MIEVTPETVQVIRKLHATLRHLAVVSHAPIQGYEFAPSDVGRGSRWRTSDTRDPIPHLGLHQSKSGDTKIPRGDVDRFGDFQLGYRQKSAEYFAGRLKAMNTSRRMFREDDLTELYGEALAALKAWRHTHMPEGQEPEYGTPQWKQYIGASTETVGALARRFNVTRQYIIKIQRDYGTPEARVARVARNLDKKAA